jgi:predicted DNA-binding protein
VVERARFQLRPRVPLELARRLKSHATATATTESAITERAIEQYLDGTSDHTALMRRLDRIERQYVRSRRDTHILAESFAAFVQLWYAYTPELPEDARDRARRSSARRYEQFLQLVAERLGHGRPFLDDLAKDFGPELSHTEGTDAD